MWEAIRANRRRSFVLITLMALVLVGLGGSIGGAFGAEQGAGIGALIAVIVWFVLWMVALTGGKAVMLASAGAHEIQHDDAPMLFNVVEEMTIASGLPQMPKVYIIDSDAPNAFAVGSEDKAAVAVTSGLLMQLNRDELQGVIAHEIGHIKNHDTRFMVLAGVMMGAIVLLAHGFARSMFYSGAGRRRGRGGGGGQAQVIFMVVAILFAILAPIVAQLLYFACSRRREYLADASSALFTRYPEGLASALTKIAGSAGSMTKVNKAVAPMFIINPLKGSAAHSIFSTHPPTEERVGILRSMAGGADYAQYESAFSGVHGGHLLGQRTLADARSVGARGASAEPEKGDMAKARDAVDILHRMGGLLFLTCACGLKMKVPPQYKGKDVKCPRCSRQVPLPKAAAMAVAAGAAMEAAGEPLLGEDEAAPTEAGALAFRHKAGQWESFRCECDRTVNVGPSFSGNRIKCPGCGRTISVETA